MIRKFLFTVTMLFCSIASGQDNSVTSANECRKLESIGNDFRFFRTIGICGLAGSTVLTGVGIGLLASADWVTYYSYENGNESGNVKGGIGASLCILGVEGMALSGAATVITHLLLKEQTRKLRQKQCAVNFEYRNRSLLVSYNF